MHLAFGGGTGRVTSAGTVANRASDGEGCRIGPDVVGGAVGCDDPPRGVELDDRRQRSGGGTGEENRVVVGGHEVVDRDEPLVDRGDRAPVDHDEPVDRLARHGGCETTVAQLDPPARPEHPRRVADLLAFEEGELVGVRRARGPRVEIPEAGSIR